MVLLSSIIVDSFYYYFYLIYVQFHDCFPLLIFLSSFSTINNFHFFTSIHLFSSKHCCFSESLHPWGAIESPLSPTYHCLGQPLRHPASQPLHTHRDCSTNIALSIFFLPQGQPSPPSGMSPPIMSISFSSLPLSLRPLRLHHPNRPVSPAPPPPPLWPPITACQPSSPDEAWCQRSTQSC